MPAVLDRRGQRLTEALRAQIPGDGTPGPGGLLGLELEFGVRSQHGARVHFGSLIHHLVLDGSALDPGDPNAYRCPWGGVITADGAEAEIATPPVRTRPGFAGELQGWARSGETALRHALPAGFELDGYSAHFSAAMPARPNDRVCRLYTETFAAGLMLLTGRADSPGLLVRPRPGRTELCGEFTAGLTLPAVAAFVAGSARVCAAAVRRPGRGTAPPPRLDVRLARAVHRYGWYVDRDAFGTDLHATSRRALLPRASGGTISAQSHLEIAWNAARQALADDAAASDIGAADAMVDGSLPLPAELAPPAAPGPHGDLDRLSAGSHAVCRATAPRLGVRARPGFTIRPCTATWDFVVFEAAGSTRNAYACIPRDSLPGFTAALDAGALDDIVAAYLALPGRRRLLSAHRQTRQPGLYDELGSRAALVAPERDPATGRREPAARQAKHALTRPGKRHHDDKRHDEDRTIWQKPWGRLMVIGAVVTALLGSAGVATAVLRHHHGPGHGHPVVASTSISPPPPQQPATIQPPALSFARVAVNSVATKPLTITNPRHTPLTVTHLSIIGPARSNFLLSVPASPGPAHGSGLAVAPSARTCLTPLGPGRSCTISVAFTPTVAGLYTADLRIYFAAQAQPRLIPLTGTGVTAAAGTLTLAPAALPAAQAGTPYTARITATGGTAPYSYSVTFGTLPPGLSLNAATGAITGSPTTVGSYSFTITASDSSAGHKTGSQPYRIRVGAAAVVLALAPATLPSDQVGTAYTQLITASGGTAPYSFSVTSGALPPGLSLNVSRPTFGRSIWTITGTPTTPGSYSFTITATDSAPSHDTGSGTYTLQITTVPITLSPTDPILPEAIGSNLPKCPGNAYSQTITASGGTPPYLFSVTQGSLPPGLTLSGGTISGIATAGGTYTFTITATDSSATPNTGSQAYIIPAKLC